MNLQSFCDVLDKSKLSTTNKYAIYEAKFLRGTYGLVCLVRLRKHHFFLPSKQAMVLKEIIEEKENITIDPEKKEIFKINGKNKLFCYFS